MSKDVVRIVQERMERFFTDPVNYDGPFSGITYGDVMKREHPQDTRPPYPTDEEEETLP